MILRDLIEGVAPETVSGNMEMDVTGITYDSRTAIRGCLFVALRGEKADGHDFVGDAVQRGAHAVVYERPLRECPGSVTCISVRDSREALASISNNFFGKPSHSMSVIGITGTNGKTTTAFVIKSILESWGKKVGLIGTIQYTVGNKVYDAIHTTPEAPEFQRLLSEMSSAGCSHVVSEVSSHALAQRRVDATCFGAAVFTNLTSEHLDFHKTMENYFLAKKRLFTELLAQDATAVINYDDIWGRRLLDSFSGNTITYGLEAGSDLMATDINNTADGLRFTIVYRERRYEIRSPLMGLPNVYNILSAAGNALSLGVPSNIIIDGIHEAGIVRGRFEKVDAGQGFFAIVDYAHTEDALERLIYTARGITKGKIITVFGCGGDRDRTKRPRMGSIATRLSDFVLVTSDNPRSEDPERIIEEIEKGAVRRNYLIEPDRKVAIRRAVMMAAEGDVVLIAGKGHETYQEIKGKRFQLNDREVLEEAIRQVINHN